MGLIRFLTDAIIDWARETVINLSGRVAEEFVSKRVKRRRRKTKRRRNFSISR